MNGFLDVETVEPAQLAAVAIDPDTLKVVEWGGEFDSLMCPEGDWRERVDPGALWVNKLDVEEIAKAPPRKEVWHAFAEWCRQFNPKGKGVKSNPIPAGKHIREFDLPIVAHLSRLYGTVDGKGLQTVFHRRPGAMWGKVVDVEDELWSWFEGPDSDLKGLSMDVVRGYLGLSDEQAHTARVDSYQTAEMICRFLRLKRKLFKQIPFKGSMADYRVPAKAGVPVSARGAK